MKIQGFHFPSACFLFHWILLFYQGITYRKKWFPFWYRFAQISYCMEIHAFESFSVPVSIGINPVQVPKYSRKEGLQLSLFVTNHSQQCRTKIKSNKQVVLVKDSDCFISLPFLLFKKQGYRLQGFYGDEMIQLYLSMQSSCTSWKKGKESLGKPKLMINSNRRLVRRNCRLREFPY